MYTLELKQNFKQFAIDPTRMNLVSGYSSDSENEPQIKPVKINPPISINATPDVDTVYVERERTLGKGLLVEAPETKKAHLTGKVENWHINNFTFEEQYHNFVKYGFAMDPNLDKKKLVVVNENDNKNDRGLLMTNLTSADINDPKFTTKSVYGLHTQEENNMRKELKKKRKKYGDASTGDFQGPWAGYDGEEILQVNSMLELDEERKAILSAIEEKRKQKMEEAKTEAELKIEATFHGDSKYDYKGRSFIMPPVDMKSRDHVCYIPKQPVHVWKGHTKGVQVVKFFPKYGHFALSGSLDTTVKLWDVFNNRKCMMTYSGHSEAVRDVCWTNDGLHFLSASYDKRVHYWDTETGKVIRSFELKKFPYCVRFHPDDDKQYAFLCASSNKKIGQFDIRTGHRVQQYDEHLGPVNTVTFIDQGRKFVSTADDKKIFLWEFGIPVVIKHISEPELHAITAAAMHPSDKYFAGQSADNRIVIYDSKNGNFKINKKRKFMGHVSSGYAIAVTFSPDGQFVASGDADGKVFFWDWKSTRTLRTFNAHEGVCIGIDWHPMEASKFVTCGWDGLIKLWD